MIIKTDIKWSSMSGIGPKAWDRDEQHMEFPMAHHHEAEHHHALKTKPKTTEQTTHSKPGPDQ